MSAVGFEPTRIAPRELESRALDRSAKLTLRSLNNKTLIILLLKKSKKKANGRVRTDDLPLTKRVLYQLS